MLQVEIFRADRVEKREGQFCAVSADGSRSFGCFDTEAEANERLRQVEAAVAAKGDVRKSYLRDGYMFRVDRLGPIHCDKTRTDGHLAELTPEGFLQCEALITRTGVFDYQDAEGNEWGEFRDAKQVFAPDSLESFRMVVVTDDHPADMVNSSNVKDVQVGHVGSDIRRDGDFVRASLVITDPRVIRSIQDGKLELSCGYFAQVIQDAGVAPDGTPFTSRQTNIRGNHLALVEQGRAGPSCRLLLDSGDAITKQDIRMAKPNKKTKENDEKRKDARVIVAGEEFDVPDEVALALSERDEKIEALALELANLKQPDAEEEEVAEEVAEVEADASDEPESGGDAEEEEMKTDAKAKAKQDAMQARIDSLETKLEDATSGQDARIDARVALVTTCKEILGADFKTDSVTEIDLRKAVVCHARGWDSKKLDGKTADYVRSAYDIVIEDESKRVDSSGDLLNLTGQAIVDNADGDRDEKAEQAHTDMLKRYQDSYRGKPAKQEMN